MKPFMRTARVDAELAGQKISKGDWLMLSYASANRDETVFERPCIGQHLGRMEMRILWEELLPRRASLDLAGEPALTSATFISGPKHVPIRYRMN